MDKVFTFWEGEMPEYLKLCMKTWDFDYIVLTYNNLNQYTNLEITPQLKRFTLPQIADCVRVHVLRDQGGYWLDTDTIVLGDLPEENIVGDPAKRTNTIGFLHTEPNSHMYIEWAKYQDSVIQNPNPSNHWSIMGNTFTDEYIKQHNSITIHPVNNCWAEVYMITDEIPRNEKYIRFYFNRQYTLSNLLPTNMLMLHNSWTPWWYKKLSKNEVLMQDCTLSNILREVL